MLILGIETSCDDTAAALVEVKRGRFMVRKNVVASQANLHAKYRGVVPEVAARAHLETIIPVINEVLDTTPSPSSRRRGNLKIPSFSMPDPYLIRGRCRAEGPPNPWRRRGMVVDAIAVTAGPGLITSLLVGVETAKALSFAWGVPLIGVNHIEGHIYSPLLSETIPSFARRGRGGYGGGATILKFPAIALIVSGGHTELILMANHGQYKLLGRTRDDAAGETFDKAAAMLALPYPGGPVISKLAAAGNPRAFALPRPMIDRPNFEFSFSGLKNAIRLLIEDLKKSPLLPEERVSACPVLDTRVRSRETTRTTQAHPTLTLPSPLKGEGNLLNNLCASIEQAIIDVLVTKSLAAIAKEHPQTFILAGGVGANKKLRQTLAASLPKTTRLLIPRPEYCMDNAAMIAAAAYEHIKKKNFTRYDKLKADANWELV